MEKYREELLTEVKAKSLSENISDREAFFEIFCEKLLDADILEDYHYLFFKGKGKRNLSIQIDGYNYNEVDEKLTLIVIPDLAYYQNITLTKSNAEDIFRRAKAFYFDAEIVINNSEESSEGYGLAWDIINNKLPINILELIIVTDQLKSNNIQVLQSEYQGNIRIDYAIYDIQRIKEIDESKLGRESIYIDLVNDFDYEGIPVLPASQKADYKAYLANISGEILARLYDKYQSRLLEGNVRSFLQTRGKVNKGIRATILNEPERFFAYNNGIAATAEELIFNEDGTLIIAIRGLQIVNGGQTTASLANSWINDVRHGSRTSIKKIFVPMKISVVEPENAQNLIPYISKYANSQNKVSDADLESNHEFHIVFEEKSRTIIAPAVNGAQYGTYWYYERANGQYKQETYKATASSKKNFLLRYPKNQMFKKIDLAKYWMIFNKRPHTVSSGAQKNFLEFTKLMVKEWDKNPNFVNEEYFKKSVALGILFKQTDTIVRQQPWYDSYKANIVAYTLSAIFNKVDNDYPNETVDLIQIWIRQDITHGWRRQIPIVSKLMYEHLISEDRTVENVTEWAKRQTSWDIAKKIKFDLHPTFEDELLNKSYVETQKASAIKEEQSNKELDALMTVFNYGENFWKEVEQWGEMEKIWNIQDKSFLKLATRIESGGKIPTDKQAMRILQVLEKARLESFPK